MQLAFHDRRVDHGAEVVHGSIFHDLDDAGLGIELDFADMATIGEGGASGPLAHVAHVKGRGRTFGQIDPGAQLLRKLHDPDGAVGPGNHEATLGKLDIADRGLEYV